MSNPIPVSELEKALDALILEDASPMLEPGDITVAFLARRAKCGERKAEKMLKEWVDAGKAEFLGLRRIERGHRVKAWRLVTK